MERPSETLRRLCWRDEVGAFLNNLGLVGQGVEIGTWDGRYTVQVMTGTSNHGKWKNDPRWAWRGELTCVDLWARQPGVFYPDSLEAEKNIAEIFEQTKRVTAQCSRIRLMKSHSLEAAKTFPDGSLDWVYIDANHAYRAVTDDITAWYPKVRPGGLFSGHDFYTCLSVDSDSATAVMDFSEMIGTRPHITACRSWWFIKS